MLTTIFKAMLDNSMNQGVSMPTIPTPTMGGEIWWNDLAEHNGWRLQQNTVTQHARILDPYDVRRAWGDLRSMEVKFAQIAGTGNTKHSLL